MTKQQIIILAALACAVLCVLAGGAYVVISEERTWQWEGATAMVTPASAFGQPTAIVPMSYKVVEEFLTERNVRTKLVSVDGETLKFDLLDRWWQSEGLWQAEEVCKAVYDLDLDVQKVEITWVEGIVMSTGKNTCVGFIEGTIDLETYAKRWNYGQR
jgi:hypothetical protein